MRKRTVGDVEVAVDLESGGNVTFVVSQPDPDAVDGRHCVVVLPEYAEAFVRAVNDAWRIAKRDLKESALMEEEQRESMVASGVRR